VVAAFVSCSLLPHLLFEAVAYVLAGMVGIFLSKALFKYPIFSDEFSRVAQACVFLLIISCALLALSVALEIYLAQSVFHSFVHS
jgi:uncharacterized membrane protein SpoIIM required for sporulation